MGSMTTVQLTYVGPPRFLGALAQALEEAGVSASYQPPMERKDLATVAAAVTVVLAATGPVPEIIATVRAFMTRFPGTHVEGLPDDRPPSVRQRLTQLDELRADKIIDDAEYAEQRARILDDL
jgi:hypothetical protein